MRLSLRFISGAALFASMALGCSVAPMGEPQQSSQSKLLAPKALFKAKASAATTKSTGIAEWRVFRGKTDFVLSGYDSHGQSVGGTAFRFAKDGDANVLKARVLDGSSFSSSHTFGGGTAANASAKTNTAKLFRRALADMIGIRLALQAQGRGYQGNPANANLGSPASPGAGLDLGSLLGQFGGLGQSCGGDLVSMLMGALQCVSGAGGLGGLQSGNQMQLLQCALASQGAATSAGTCQNPGADPLGGPNGAPFDPAQGQDPNDPYGAQDPFGGMGMDPNGQAGQMGPLDPNGQGQYDPLGQGDPFGQQGCQSCQGQYDDFGVSGQDGAVGYDPGMGGADPGMGSDPGMGYEGI